MTRRDFGIKLLVTGHYSTVLHGQTRGALGLPYWDLPATKGPFHESQANGCQLSPVPTRFAIDSEQPSNAAVIQVLSKTLLLRRRLAGLRVLVTERSKTIAPGAGNDVAY